MYVVKYSHGPTVCESINIGSRDVCRKLNWRIEFNI